MKNKIWLILFFLAGVGCNPALHAETVQEGLKIEEVFRKYGNKKNVTMVELSGEMLDTYGMAHYKSITIKGDAGILADVRRYLEADQDGARKIKEITDSGGIISAYYQLKSPLPDLNRFILFKVNKKLVITLIYIEGELDSDDLITLLFTQKDFN